jgi:hypothetical protein
MELTYGHCIQSLLAKRVKLPYTDDDPGGAIPPKRRLRVFPGAKRAYLSC